MFWIGFDSRWETNHHFFNNHVAFQLLLARMVRKRFTSFTCFQEGDERVIVGPSCTRFGRSSLARRRFRWSFSLSIRQWTRSWATLIVAATRPPSFPWPERELSPWSLVVPRAKRGGQHGIWSCRMTKDQDHWGQLTFPGVFQVSRFVSWNRSKWEAAWCCTSSVPSWKWFSREAELWRNTPRMPPGCWQSQHLANLDPPGGHDEDCGKRKKIINHRTSNLRLWRKCSLKNYPGDLLTGQ